MEIQGNTYKSSFYLSESEILKKIKQSKSSIQEIKIGLASFDSNDPGQDSFVTQLFQERKNYAKLLRDLGIVKSRNKQVANKQSIKQQLEKMRTESQEDSKNKLKNEKFRFNVFSNYQINIYEKNSLNYKQIIDTIIY